MDLTAFFKISYGLYIVSSCYEEKCSGLIVNTVQQVTAIPEKISITVSKNSFTSKLIEKSGKFCATVLAKETPMELIAKFGFASGENRDKFQGFNTDVSANGIKYVTDFATAVFSCNVIQTTDLDTHITFVGIVIEAEVLSSDEPLTYGYYYDVKRGKTPKDAPSYKAPQEKKAYRCKVCGYIAQIDTLPEDYICPLCKQGKDKFEKI